MTDEQNELIEKKLKTELDRAFRNGMSNGAKSMCMVILEKCNQKKNPAKIVEDVKRFCETGLGKRKGNK